MNLGCRYQNQSGQTGTDYYAQYNSGYYGPGVYDASYYYQKQAQSTSQQSQPAPEDPTNPSTTACSAPDKTDVVAKSSQPAEVTEPTAPGADDMEGGCCVQHMLVTLILLTWMNY